jgi:hypothetical protein
MPHNVRALGFQQPCARCLRTEETCTCPAVPHYESGDIEFLGTPSSAIPRYVGLELEVCGVRTRRMGRAITETVRRWGGTVKGDGSLPVGGFEINLAPARGAVALKQISEVGHALAAADAWVDNRAGGHVHVDARGLSIRTVSALFALWYLLEDEVFRQCAPTRVDNTYCRRWRPRSRGVVHEHLALSEALLYNPQWLFRDANRSDEYDGESGASFRPWRDRYHSLNLCPLQSHLNTQGLFPGSTVEFRLFPGTVSIAEASRNAILASRLVHVAEYWGRDRLRRAFRNNNPSGLFHEVLGVHGRRMHQRVQREQAERRAA